MDCGGLLDDFKQYTAEWGQVGDYALIEFSNAHFRVADKTGSSRFGRFPQGAFSDSDRSSAGKQIALVAIHVFIAPPIGR
jgi:hypothetical protein